MKIGTGIIILLLAVVTLVAEIILYFIMGIGAAFSGNAQSVPGIAMFFIWLMVMTIAVGVVSPLSALLEQLVKKRNLSIYILVPALGLVGIGTALILFIGYQVAKSHAQPPAQTVASAVSAASAASAEDSNASYVDKIEIKNLTVGQTVFYDTGVFGELKNKGDRTVTGVDIVIKFLNKDSQIIAESNYSPIRKDSLFPDTNAPLKPNFVRKFGYRASEAPAEWAHKVAVSVVKVELEP
jgi:hypothetical protein